MNSLPRKFKETVVVDREAAFVAEVQDDAVMHTSVRPEVGQTYPALITYRAGGESNEHRNATVINHLHEDGAEWLKIQSDNQPA